MTLAIGAQRCRIVEIGVGSIPSEAHSVLSFDPLLELSPELPPPL